MKKLGNILWGLVFIIIGVIWGINSLGIANINIFFDGWWTLFIIIPCFIELIKGNGVTGNIIGIIIGIMLLLSAQEIISFEILGKLLLPLILVLIGFSMIISDTVNSKIRKKIKSLNKEGLDEYCATFGEQKVNLKDEEFCGANLNAIFGGVEVDLRDAKIEKEQIINASAIFGGITIMVPKDVNIKVKSTPIFGGVSNKISNSNKSDDPIIYINAFCLFGGVDIK